MDINQNSFKRIIENLHDGLYIVDKERAITYWNKAAEKISGFSAEEVMGKHCYDNILTHVDLEGNSLCLMGCPLRETISDGVPREGEVFLHHKDGHRVPISVRVSQMMDDQGQIIGGIELFTDISHNKINEVRIRELEKIALLDQLTELANRRFIQQELHNRFEEKRRLNVPFGILFIDIDFFKKVNDTYGHSVGDKVLKFVAKTLQSNARPFDLFGRWGGEEFIGIIRNIEKESLETLGNRLRRLIENSYILEDDKKIGVTISLGASMVFDEDSEEDLIKRVDSLLYKSKKDGRNRLTID